MQRTCLTLPLFLLALFAMPGAAAAGCYVQFDSTANQVMHMNGNVQRGNFATMADCQRYQASRPAFEQNHSWCAGTCGGGSSGYSGGYSGGYNNPMVGLFGAMLQSFVQAALAPNSGSGSGGSSAPAQPQGPSPEQLAAEKKRNEELWAKAQAQIKDLEAQYKDAQARNFAQANTGLAQGLKDRYAASYGASAGGAVTPAANAACWSKLAAGTRDAELSRKYSGYAEAAMNNKDAPACPGASAAGSAPEPPAPVPADFSQQFASFVAEERTLLVPMIAGLKERTTAMAAEVDTKQKAVAELARKQESAPDPAAKQEADDLLAQAQKALAEAQEENRKASQDLDEAEKRLQGLDLMAKAAAEPKPAAPAPVGSKPAPAKPAAN